MFNSIKEADRTQLFVALGVLLVALYTYLDTVAPTVSFWDAGEYIATAYTLGVPHPPGAPFFLILARIFTMIPIGDDIAYRVNLLSVISSALTVMFTFLIIVKLVRQWKGELKTAQDKFVAYSGGVIGALSFTWSDSFWFNAVEAEVYALSALFTAVVVWLALHWLEHSDKRGSSRYLLMIAYVMGLAIGVHLLSLLALPVVALIIYFKKYEFSPKSFIGLIILTGFTFIVIYLGVVKGVPTLADKTSFGWVFAAVVALYVITFWSVKNGNRILTLALLSTVLLTVGYSTYAIIYVRANANPFINENNPSNTQRLVSYMNREQYGDAPFFDRKRWKPRMAKKYSGESDYFWNYQIKRMYVRYFNWQFIGRKGGEVDASKFYGLPFLLGLFGAYYHYRKDPKQAFNVLSLFFMTGLAIVLYLNQEDPQPRERDYSYVGSFMAYSLWIGLGATGLLELASKQFKERKTKQYVLYFLASLILIIVPINMAAKGWREHDRSGNYVAWDYSYNILATAEPNAIIFTNGDNDTFPVWYLQEVEGIRKDVRVVNLSLLNTRWYIRQLRDNEPKVPITFTDRDIDRLTLTSWPKAGNKVSLPGAPDEFGNSTPFEWRLKATINTSNYSALRVQDLMILHILEANRWERPVYFAVTVSQSNKLGLERFLRMDGLAFKILDSSPIETDSDGNPLRIEPMYPELITPTRIESNLVNNYKYRGLDDPDVYINPSVKKLLQNYRSAYMQLGFRYVQEGEKDKLIKLLASMEENIPEEVIPITSRMAKLQIGSMEKEAGFPEKMKKRLENLLANPRSTFNDRLIYGNYYLRELGDFETATRIFNELVVEQPNSGRAVGMLVSTYDESKDYMGALRILNDWLVLHPNDNNARLRMDELRAKMDSVISSQ